MGNFVIKRKTPLYTSRILLLTLLLVVGAGCAVGRYNVQVNGYTEGTATAMFAPGAAFCVLENKEATNPLLEKEIKEKIVKLLEKAGYRLVPAEAAEYYLLFSYGVGPGRSVIISVPECGPVWGAGVGYGYGPAYTFFWPGFVTYVPYTRTVYDRWLLLNVVDGKFFRDTGRHRPLWVGDIKSTGASSDLREVVNPMLAAAFTQFGKNTGKALTLEIAPDDPRVKELQLFPGKP